MKILDLGSGPKTKKLKESGVVTLDISPEVEPDIVWDVNKTPLPFKDNEFDEVRAISLLEHLENDKYEDLIEEMHRITKPTGKVVIKVPYFSSPIAFETTGRNGHVSFFAYNSFWRYKENDWAHYTKKVAFKILKLKLNGFLSFILNLDWRIAMFYQRFFCWIFPMNSIYVEMRPIKKK